MAVISSQGLFRGDRLAACSDRAKLYWPFLFIACNGLARLELSYASIISEIFGNFSKPLKEEELWEIFEEYATHFLVILYQVNGVWWAQFHTSEKYLPKYKTVEDNNSPAPPIDLREKHQKGYIAWKNSNSPKNQRFQKFVESSGDFSKVSDGKGVGEGVGVGKERQKQKKPIFVLPEWIPGDVWEDFEEVRKQKRAKLTNSTRWRIVDRLEEFRIRGHDGLAILEKSIRSGYTDVFEPNGGGNGHTGTGPKGKGSLALEAARGAVQNMADREARGGGDGPTGDGGFADTGVLRGDAGSVRPSRPDGSHSLFLPSRTSGR